MKNENHSDFQLGRYYRILNHGGVIFARFCSQIIKTKKDSVG